MKLYSLEACEKLIQKHLGKIYSYIDDYCLEIRIIIRSGYYSGANLDWELFYEGQEYDSIDDVICDFSQDDNERFKEYGKTIHKQFEAMADEVEEFCKENSEAYNCVAVASNGEGFYRKA